LIGLIGLRDWYFAARSVIGFKRHFVPFNGFAALSIQAPSAFKDTRHRHLKVAQGRKLPASNFQVMIAYPVK
jgi:hypothetical protein